MLQTEKVIDIKLIMSDMYNVQNLIFENISADFVLQSDRQCGTYLKPVEERVLDVDELDVFSHSGRQFYASNMDCILTIIGKTYYQWEVTVTQLNIDKYKDSCREQRAPCCNDYLKIFNSKSNILLNQMSYTQYPSLFITLLLYHS